MERWASMLGEAQPEQVDRGNHEEEEEQHHGRREQAGHGQAPARLTAPGPPCSPETGEHDGVLGAQDTTTASPSVKEGMPLGICSITRSRIPSRAALVLAARPQIHGVGDGPRQRIAALGGAIPMERGALGTEHQRPRGHRRPIGVLVGRPHPVAPLLHGDVAAMALGHGAEEKVRMSQELRDKRCARLPVELDRRPGLPRCVPGS